MLILSSWVFLDCFISQVSCFVSDAEEIGACDYCEPFIVLRTQLHILVDNHAFVSCKCVCIWWLFALYLYVICVPCEWNKYAQPKKSA